MSERYVDHVLTKINRRNRKFGDEWPSSDSEDPDYSPDQSSKNTHDSESGGSTDVEEDKCHSVKVTLKRKRTSTARTSSHMKDLDHGSNTDLHRTAGTLLSHVKNNKCHKKSAKRGKIANPNKTKKSTFSTGCSTHSDNTSSVECPHLPPELWLKVFQSVVRNAGPLPFLCRAAKVCRSWHQLCSHPSLWYIVDLSYGWIKSTDATLLWLSQHRLAHCREISLAGWKKLTNSAFVEFCQNSPDLCSVNLSMCGKLTSLAVTALARNCSHLKDLDLSSVSADAVSAQALKQITEKLGPSLKSLVLSGNCFKGFNSVLNSLMDHCVCLERLDLSNCIFSTGALTLNIERLQTSCPSLQILQLTGCQVWAPQVSQQVQEKAPGFTKLMQLGCSLSANDIFKRLLHNAKQLKTLDVRRSVSILPKTLLECAACDVEELFLSESSIINYPEMLEHLFIKILLFWL
ncbi:F-box/LRR-repeat protein 6-like isoform X2 [Pomacea canaliculata]|uniref:F-box/LRR-repeat protein 6-like isoform X2 n=1 Tax=Pomacea canaliculata TaxID=400727 RepID=UPI000D734C14|nr:F-box/LRR-repeat protein 6-like isoform X2 [Pomacea canaliculata]